VTQAERIRALADRLGYWGRIPDGQRLVRSQIATELECTPQAVTSALRHGSRRGRPRERCAQCQCDTCGGTWTATRPRKVS